MSITRVEDVADVLGRPISDPAEVTQVTAWIARVENRIRARVPDLDARVMDVTYNDTVVGVVVDVVIRRVQNPTGLKSERIDDYQATRSDTTAASDLWPTPDEWAEITPVVSRGAFTIRPEYSS